MQRYFFHLTNDETLEDELGEEFEFAEAAREHAAAVAFELAKGRPTSDVAGGYISVTDQSGTELFRVPLRQSSDLEPR
jgi:hypothetical protein